uniref:Uncharacterized protein n=1 Tax=Strongyloides stercoralis TaxID=6248 RepID=A0A0K0EDI4_STRER
MSYSIKMYFIFIFINIILSIINAQFLCKNHSDCKKMEGCVMDGFGSYCANKCTNSGTINGGCFINEMCRRIVDSKKDEAYVCITPSL